MARVIAATALVAAVALAALAMFGGGGEAYRVKAVFQNSGQLVPGNEVRVGGRTVGTIADIALDDQARAVVTMDVEDVVAPLHEGTTATIRVASLTGTANRYVSIKPGPNDGEQLADGGLIAADDTDAPVDLDQLFNALDGPTRKGLKNFVRGTADWYDGASVGAAESTTYLSPFLVSTTELTRELALDQAVFERFLQDTSTAVSAIAERRDDLAGLVVNLSATAGAIADENESLERALTLLPPTLRKANTTFVNLRSTLDDVDILVNESKENTKELDTFFRELRPLTRDARPTIADLRTLIRQPGENNDLIELLQKQPRLADMTSVMFPRAIRTLERAQPLIEYARGYTPDIAGWLTKFAAVAASYDGNGHYARVTPVFAPTEYDPATNTLSSHPPAERLEGFESGNLNRCPGGAVQPSPDGSSPWAFMGCDTSTTPPGP